jgi:hypothetical protein
MGKIIFIVITFLVSSVTSGQSCTHADLSHNFTFLTKVQRIKIGAQNFDSCLISVSVVKKQSKKTIQTIKYTSTFLYSDAFQRCDFVRSFATGKNLKVEPLDNHYGDLVIADFNFDGKDDFAVISESGVSNGPYYRFYIQNKNGGFRCDKYLSDTMMYFPSNINQKKRTLTTYTLAGSVGVYRRLYFLNKSNEWRLISKKLVTG